jgi:hypothetical protein
MVVIEAMLECCIDSLSICDLLGSEGINLVLIARISKDIIKIAHLSVPAWVLLTVKTL